MSVWEGEGGWVGGIGLRLRIEVRGGSRMSLWMGQLGPHAEICSIRPGCMAQHASTLLDDDEKALDAMALAG